MQTILMEQYRNWHITAVIVSIISLLFITYTTILINNFKTPETTADFLKNSNSYYYISEIVKANVRNHYSTRLRNNVIELTIADTLLNTIVSPNLVEQLAVPVLRIRQAASQLPLSFVEHNLVINTTQYTQQISETLSSLGLPQAILTAGNNLIASIPPQITLVDTQKHPNSILASITHTRIFFDHVQTFLTMFWLLLVLAIITLITINLKFLRRLVSGFFWIFLICGVILFIFSFVLPALLNTFSSNPDPISGVLKDQFIDGMIWQYFSQTIPISIIYVILALCFFIMFRFVPFLHMQQWINVHLLKQPSQESSYQGVHKASTKKRKKR